MAIAALVDPSLAANGAPSSLVQEIEEMVARYSENMPWKNPTSLPPSGGAVVLLTGSTGNIGSHILASLLADPRISRVYAFNRGQESAHRQAVAFRARGLPADLLFSDKYVPLVGDLKDRKSVV